MGQTLIPNQRGLVFDAIIEECSCDKIKIVVLKGGLNGNAAVAVIDSNKFPGVDDFITASVTFTLCLNEQ